MWRNRVPSISGLVANSSRFDAVSGGGHGGADLIVSATSPPTSTTTALNSNNIVQGALNNGNGATGHTREVDAAPRNASISPIKSEHLALYPNNPNHFTSRPSRLPQSPSAPMMEAIKTSPPPTPLQQRNLPSPPLSPVRASAITSNPAATRPTSTGTANANPPRRNGGLIRQGVIGGRPVPPTHRPRHAAPHTSAPLTARAGLIAPETAEGDELFSEDEGQSGERPFHLSIRSVPPVDREDLKWLIKKVRAWDGDGQRNRYISHTLKDLWPKRSWRLLNDKYKHIVDSYAPVERTRNRRSAAITRRNTIRQR